MYKTQSSFAYLLLLSSLIACLAVFGACKKDEVDKTYYIRFKTDDNKNLDYTAPLGVYATFETIGSQYSLALIESGPSYDMRLQVNDFVPIDTGTYQAQGHVDSIATLTYITWWWGFDYRSDKTGGDAKITISEITSTTVRGTFSGTIQAPGAPDLKLFDGEFFLKRIN